MDEKNVLRKLLREIVNNAVARGHLPDDDLLDELASMGPAPSADFRRRLEGQLVEELRAQEKKREDDPMASMTTDGRIWARSNTPTRAASPNRIALAAALLVVILLGAFLLMNFSGGDSLSVSFIRSAEEVNQDAFTLYIDEVWNQGNVALLNDVATEDVVYHDTTLPEDVVGIDGVSELVTSYRAAMLDLTFSIDATAVDGDRVWAQITATGTHTNTLELGEEVSIAASMNTATWTTTIISRFEDGKIAETWVSAGTLGLLEQLGVAPSLQELSAQEQNREVAERLIQDVWNRERLDTTRDVHALRFDWHAPNDGPEQIVLELTGNDLSQFIRTTERSFPDMEVTIENIIANDEYAIVLYTFRGTFERDYPGWSPFEATGEEAVWDGVFIYRFEEGLITEKWWYWDNFTLVPVDLVENIRAVLDASE